MRRIPSIIFVVDTIKEHISISEGRRLQIPIGAIVDTNCDPDAVDFPIPGNDDAIKSVQLITRAVADAILAENARVSPEEIAKTAELAAASAKLSEDEAEEEAEDASKPKRRVVHKKIVKYTEEE